MRASPPRKLGQHEYTRLGSIASASINHTRSFTMTILEIQRREVSDVQPEYALLNSWQPMALQYLLLSDLIDLEVAFAGRV